MNKYKMLMGLVSISFSLLSLSMHSVDPVFHKTVMWQMEFTHDQWWRDKIRKLWDQDLIAVEHRKEITPETINLASFITEDTDVGGFFDPSCSAIVFPKQLLVETVIENAFFGYHLFKLSHEYVHFCKDSEKIQEDEILICSLWHGEEITFLTEANGVLPGDENADIGNKKTDSTLTAGEQSKARLAIMHKEAYADLKGLELLQSKMTDDYHAYLHFLNNRCRVKKLASGHGKKYLELHEVLFCWGLYQQRKKHSDVDSDTILREVIDHYLHNRGQYNIAMQSLHFLKKFNNECDNSWRGTIEKYDPNRNCMEASTYIANFCHKGIAVMTGGALAGVGLPFGIGPAVLLGIGSYYSTLGLFKRNQIVPKIGVSLGKAYNSSFMWDRDKFATALDTDVARVSKLASRLIKRDEQRKIQREEERKLFASKQETESIRLYFGRFNPFG